MHSVWKVSLWKWRKPWWFSPESLGPFRRFMLRLNTGCVKSKDYYSCCGYRILSYCLRGFFAETWEGHNLSWTRCLVINPDDDAAADRLMCKKKTKKSPDARMNCSRCRKVACERPQAQGLPLCKCPLIHLSCICPAVTPQALLSSTLSKALLFQGPHNSCKTPPPSTSLSMIPWRWSSLTNAPFSLRQCMCCSQWACWETSSTSRRKPCVCVCVCLCVCVVS